MAQEKIAFRRIRGRIVPIRLSKGQKKAVQGTALVAGGTTAAVAAGKVAGSALHAAAKAENIARTFKAKETEIVESLHNRIPNQQVLPGFKIPTKPKRMTPMLKRQLKAAAQAGTSETIKAARLFKFSEHARKIGTLAGGVLIGSGFTNLYESIKGQEASLPEEIIAQGAGQLTSAALEAGFVSTTQAGGNLFKAVRILAKAKLKL